MPAPTSKATKLFRLSLNAAGVLVLAGGCANIIGTSDLDNDEDAAIVGGSGGATGKGGSAGASKGGSSSKGGSAGSSDGGAPPMTGGAVDCNGDPLELNEALIRGCILYESCFLPSRSITTCVSYNMPAVFTGLACAQGAMDCSDIVTCRHSAYMHPEAPVTCEEAGGSATMGACVNNQAINCDNAITPQYTDCTAAGAECDLQDDGWAACKVLETCEQPNLGTGCDGNVWYYCWGGVGWGTDCANSAASCTEYTDPDTNMPAHDCYYATTSCGADSAECSGDSAVLCSGGTRYQYDCGASNLGCDDSTTDLYCLAPGCTTNDADTCLESCSGSELTFCIGGSPVTVDCTSYGFDTCREDDLNGFTVAVCGYNY